MPKLTPEEAAKLGLPGAPSAAKQLTAEEATKLGLPTAPPEVKGSLGRDIETGIMNAADWATLGAAPALTSVQEALIQKAKGNPKPFMQLQSEYMQGLHKRYAESPVASTIGSTFGGIATGLASAGAAATRAAVPAAQSALGRMFSSGARLAPVAAASGGLSSEAPDIQGKINDALAAGATGTALGFGLGAVPEAFRGAGKLGRKFFDWLSSHKNPTAAAKFLEEQGVKGLTAGQRAPESAIGKMEEATAKNPLGLEPQRRAALASAREVGLNKALPPGMEPPTGTMQERLQSAYEGFEPAYAKIRNEPVYPAIHGKGTPLQGTSKTPGAFDLLVRDNNRPITEDTRKAVKGFLDQQLSVLPGGTTRPAMLAPVDAADLLKMRSNIREASRAARAEGKNDQKYLLDLAENAVTETIKSQLSPEASAHLAATDRQYRLFKIFEDAGGRANIESEFSPAQFRAAVKKATGKSGWGRGQGGDIQDYAEAVEKVFGPKLVETGYRDVVLGMIPSPVAVQLARIANLPRPAPLPRVVRGGLNVPALQAVRGLSPELQLAAAAADEDEDIR